MAKHSISSAGVPIETPDGLILKPKLPPPPSREGISKTLSLGGIGWGEGGSSRLRYLLKLAPVGSSLLTHVAGALPKPFVSYT